MRHSFKALGAKQPALPPGEGEEGKRMHNISASLDFLVEWQLSSEGQKQQPKLAKEGRREIRVNGMGGGACNMLS